MIRFRFYEGAWYNTLNLILLIKNRFKALYTCEDLKYKEKKKYANIFISTIYLPPISYIRLKNVIDAESGMTKIYAIQ